MSDPQIRVGTRENCPPVLRAQIGQASQDSTIHSYLQEPGPGRGKALLENQSWDIVAGAEALDLCAGGPAAWQSGCSSS